MRNLYKRFVYCVFLLKMCFVAFSRVVCSRLKEEWETEFNEFNVAFGFSSWYTCHFFHYNWMQNCRTRPGFVSKCCQQYSLHISVENQKLLFFDQITLDCIFSKSHFLTLCLVSQIAYQFFLIYFMVRLKSSFTDPRIQLLKLSIQI